MAKKGEHIVMHNIIMNKTYNKEKLIKGKKWWYTRFVYRNSKKNIILGLSSHVVRISLKDFIKATSCTSLTQKMLHSQSGTPSKNFYIRFDDNPKQIIQ